MPLNTASILDTVKKALGVDYADTSFDVDIVMFINSVLGDLQQMGAGPREGFTIADNTTLWSDYISAASVLGLVKTYITLKVGLIFDPPQVGFVIAAREKLLEENAARIVMAVENLDPPISPIVNRHAEELARYRLLGDETWAQLESVGGIIGVSGDNFSVAAIPCHVPYWWNLTGHENFPAEAEPGDYGVDTVSCEVFAYERLNATAYWWDLTGGIDFPADALVGDLGIDYTTGKLWRHNA